MAMPIGSADNNLAAAIAGEAEAAGIYEAFAVTAREEGLETIAEWFEKLARAEHSHQARFTKARRDLQDKDGDSSR